MNRKSQTVQNYPYPGPKSISYKYDTTGNRTKLTYPDSTYITYEYDQLNRLIGIKDQALSPIASYSYDTLSRRTGLTLLNGTSASYTYDTINRLTELTNTYNPTPNIYTYTYDNVGNRLTKTDTTGTETYTYDNIYQVTNVTYPDTTSSTAYNYDSLGNRTNVVNSGTTTYSSNNLNQYTTVGAVGYTYDTNGNLTSDATNTYSYDSENRLITASKTGMNATYAYDAFGRRIEKSVDGIVTKYLYDGDQVIVEYDGSDTLIRKFIYSQLIDDPIIMDDGTEQYYYHFDGLGSVTSLSDSNGDLTESYSYDIFGEVTSSLSGVGNPYYFTGRRYDEETGLYYFRERYYDPRIGRFISRDPWSGFIQDPSTFVNKYIYVGNNPINWLDPYGLCKDDKDKDKPLWKKLMEKLAREGLPLPSKADPAYEVRKFLEMKTEIDWEQKKYREETKRQTPKYKRDVPAYSPEETQKRHERVKQDVERHQAIEGLLQQYPSL